MIDCPFCPLLKLSEWYLTTDDNITVCKDINSRKFKYRILVVGSGKKYHRKKQNYSQKEIERMVRLGKKVAEEHIKQGRAKKIAMIDTSKFSIIDHFHLQFCMEG